MNKYFFLTFALILLPAALGVFPRIAKENVSTVFNPTPTPRAVAEIEKVKVDKNEVVIICPYHKYCGETEDFQVRVQTIVRNPNNASLKFAYPVSGGRIVGQGSEVLWDLKGVRPGAYTITVGIDEGYGYIAETKSEVVIVKECSVCDPPCICPRVEMNGKETVRASESLVFTIAVVGGTVTDLTYNWTVSQGEIISGQGTTQIKVRTTREMTGYIKATVQIAGAGLCENCTTEITHNTQITK